MDLFRKKAPEHRRSSFERREGELPLQAEGSGNSISATHTEIEREREREMGLTSLPLLAEGSGNSSAKEIESWSYGFW